jgi:sugar lactone lactonase YvrE
VEPAAHSPITPERQPLADDFRFPEGARWHDDRLWVADMHGGGVFRIDPVSGAKEVVLQVRSGRASGIGWLPDGRLLAVSMLDRIVERLEPDGTTSVHADLSEGTEWPINDMFVDSSGVAFVGCFGYDVYGGGDPRPGPLFRVSPDGSWTVVAETLTMANGTVTTPGGESVMVIAETWDARLTAFDVDDDRQLSGQRQWASIPGTTPDGICIDREGAIWVASILSHEFLRVIEGGEVTDRISAGGRHAIDCVLGGEDGRTLFLLTSDTYIPEETEVSRQGRIETVRVSVPG